MTLKRWTCYAIPIITVTCLIFAFLSQQFPATRFHQDGRLQLGHSDVRTESNALYFESPYRDLHDVCEREEFSIWRITENKCKEINNATSLKAWSIDAFSFYENVRTHELTNDDLNSDPMLLVAFDIVGPVGSFGNWWRVMLQNATDSLSIQVAGRVVDNWNGKYTVYMHLPVAGEYIMDILLEYMACQGYPDGFAKHPVETLYHGSYKRISVKWHVHQPTLHKTTSTLRAPKATNGLDVFRYLADTGYYRDDIWRPAAMTYACYPQTKLPLEATSIVFEGDSTIKQQFDCAVAHSHDCRRKASHWNGTLAMLSRGMWDAIAASRKTDYIQTWEQDFSSFSRIPNITYPAVLLMNAGIHYMILPWQQQKTHLNSISKSIATLPNIATSATDTKQKVSIVWRDTWSIHEYCYVPNPYWEEIVWKGEGVPWFHDAKILEAYEKHIKYLRDPVSHLLRSYALDVIVRGTNKTHWLPSHFASKAAIKPKMNKDTRHHDVRVIVGLWRSMLEMYNFQ